MDFQKYVYNIKSHISKVYSHEIMKNFMLPLLRVIYGKMWFTRSTVEIRLYRYTKSAESRGCGGVRDESAYSNTSY